MYTKSEKIEILKSAGYSENTARKSLDIGVHFFDNIEELKSFDSNAPYDIGHLNNKDIYFINTSIM